MTRRQLYAALGAAVLGLAGWTALASAVALAILGQFAYFRAPWIQWWLIEPYWRLNWFEAIAIWGGAIVAALPFAPLPFAIVAIRKHSQKQQNQERLYGQTRWASALDLAAGGFRETRGPQ